MNKGTVLSIDEKWATVFTEDCQLIKLPLRPDMAVGREINLVTEQAQSRKGRTVSRFKPAFLAACFVLLLTVGLMFGRGLIFNPVYATVSIDVNPSLELSLNRRLQVLSVKAMNEDAERLVVGEDFRGLGVDEAILQWIGKLQAGHPYPVKTLLLSAVIPDRDEALITRLIRLEQTQNQGELKNLTVRFIYTHDQTVRKQASDNGLSIGRQLLLNQANRQNQNDTRESIARAPLDELIARLLRDQERNLTRLTEQTTHSSSDPSGSGTSATSRVTSQSSNPSGSSSATGSGSSTTQQNSHSFTKGSTTGSGTGTTAPNQTTGRITSGTPQASGTGTSSTASGPQTSGSTQGTGTASTGGPGNG